MHAPIIKKGIHSGSFNTTPGTESIILCHPIRRVATANVRCAKASVNHRAAMPQTAAMPTMTRITIPTQLLLRARRTFQQSKRSRTKVFYSPTNSISKTFTDMMFFHGGAEKLWSIHVRNLPA
jgi:hypothetical protein